MELLSWPSNDIPSSKRSLRGNSWTYDGQIWKGPVSIGFAWSKKHDASYNTKIAKWVTDWLTD